MWLDAKDSHLVIQDDDDDAASVASDASTVVPDHHSIGAGAEQPEQAAVEEPHWGQHAEQAAAPAELPEAPAAAAAAPQEREPAPLPEQLQQHPFGAAPVRRSSLSPAPPGGSRRSSFGVVRLVPAQPADEEEGVRISLAAGIAEVAAAAQATAAVAEEAAPAEQQKAHAAAAEAAAPAPSPQPSCASLAPQPEGSRLSVASTASGAPSLRIEYSEASLRYSGAL